MKYWTLKIPDGETGVVNVPFNIEEFCRENDQLLEQANKLHETLTYIAYCQNSKISYREFRLLAQKTLKEIKNTK
jgi:hypothetical protein